MQFFIDITDSSGTKYGSGPIASASYWKSTKRVDRVGNFEFAMPASDEKAALLANRRYATCYAILDSGPTEVGGGVIDHIETRPDADGNVELVVSGDDLLRELTWRIVGRIAFVDGDLPTTQANAAGTLSLLLPAGWTITPDPAPPNDDIYYYFNGEKVWAAALKLGELSRCHAWMPTTRALRYQSVWTNSGLRAIEAPANPGATAPNLCYISALSAAEDTYDLVTRIYAYGQEIPDLPYHENIGLNHATKAALGYTLAQDATLLQYYLERDDAALAYGQIEEWVTYNEITAPANTGNYVETAANQMFDLVLWELQRRGQPVSYYKLSLSHAPIIVEPMQTIRCVFRRAVDGRNVTDINALLYVMGATTTVDTEGMRTTDLEVATLDRWQPSDLETLRKLTLDNLRSNL